MNKNVVLTAEHHTQLKVLAAKAGITMKDKVVGMISREEKISALLKDWSNLNSEARKELEIVGISPTEYKEVPINAEQEPPENYISR